MIKKQGSFASFVMRRFTCLGGFRAEQLGPKVVEDISKVGFVEMNVMGCVGPLFVVGEEGVVVVKGMEVDGVMQDFEIFTT